MSTLTIADLSDNKKLDHQAMAAVRGGESKKPATSSSTQSSQAYLVFTLSSVLISDYPRPD